MLPYHHQRLRQMGELVTRVGEKALHFAWAAQ